MIKKITFTFLIGFTTTAFGQIVGGGATDYNGNTYTTVHIGTQEWFSENLRATSFNNGDPISNITDNVAWYSAVGQPAYCDYNNMPSMSIDPYGRIYNYFAAEDSRNVCPTGWRVPSSTDFETLIDYLGGSSVSGGKMKVTGTTYWSPNVGATNESGFSGISNGQRDQNGIFETLGCCTYWWSTSTEPISGDGIWYALGGAVSNTGAGQSELTRGFTVRCMRESTNSIEINESNNSFKLYPNPVKDILNLEVEQNSTLEIMQVDGTILSRLTSMTEVTTVDVSSFDAGIYIVRITENKGKIGSLRFVKL